MTRDNSGAIGYDNAACLVPPTSQRRLRDAQWRAWLATSGAVRDTRGARSIAHIRVSGDAKRRRGRFRWRISAAAAGMIVLVAILG